MAFRRNHSGCGCLLVFFIVVGILSGIRGCTEKMINGDLKMPKSGSSRVSGGSGGYGTSNGYNVKYNQTTSPNYNSSSNDYTHTNSQPTEYREGNNTQKANKYSGNSSSYSSSDINTISNSSSHSSISGKNSNANASKPQRYYKICSRCDGTGKVVFHELVYEKMLGGSCSTCGRSDTHYHDQIMECQTCSGKGKYKVEIVNGPLGEMEMRVYE